MKTANKSSGLKGVTLEVNRNGEMLWRARVQGKKLRVSKRFPFTEEGKKEAHEFYLNTIKENREKYYNYSK